MHPHLLSYLLGPQTILSHFFGFYSFYYHARYQDIITAPKKKKVKLRKRGLVMGSTVVEGDSQSTLDSDQSKNLTKRVHNQNEGNSVLPDLAYVASSKFAGEKVAQNNVSTEDETSAQISSFTTITACSKIDEPSSTTTSEQISVDKLDSKKKIPAINNETSGASSTLSASAVDVPQKLQAMEDKGDSLAKSPVDAAHETVISTASVTSDQAQTLQNHMENITTEDINTQLVQDKLSTLRQRNKENWNHLHSLKKDVEAFLNDAKILNGTRDQSVNSKSTSTYYNDGKPTTQMSDTHSDLNSSNSASLDDILADDWDTLHSEVHYIRMSQSYKPKAQYIIDFPYWLDQAFQPMDRTATHVCQNFLHSKYSYQFAYIFSTLTAVETALGFPFALYALGYDKAATIFLCFLLSLGFVSQLPKRFVWRPRPWMLGRAKKSRNDKTSSFPSRAIACGVVFPVMTMYGYGEQTENHFAPFTYLAITSFIVICTTYARVHVGAHYISDTIGGLFMSIVCVWGGFLLLKVFQNLGCGLDECYVLDSQYALTSMFSKEVNFYSFLLSILVSHLVTIVSVIAPINFWMKNSYVYGLLFSCITFKFTYLCPSIGTKQTGFLPPASQSWFKHICVSIIGILFVIGGMLIETKKKGSSNDEFRRSLIKFSIIYFGSLMIITNWRIYFS